MHIEPKHILLIIAMVLLFANRLMQNNPFIAKHSNLIRVLVFMILIAVLVMQFYKSKSGIILIVAAVGIVSIGWIVYDMNRKDDDEDSGSSEKKDEKV